MHTVHISDKPYAPVAEHVIPCKIDDNSTRRADLLMTVDMARSMLRLVRAISISRRSLAVGGVYQESPEDRMTRLRPSKTGLPMHINISVAQPLENPCIKVSKTTKDELPSLKDMFSVSIPADPCDVPVVRGDLGDITDAELQQVHKFIEMNRDTLLITWYQMDGCAVYMRKIKNVCH